MPDATRLAQLYNLTVEDYYRILRYQGGNCGLTKRPSARLVVDHCHATGTIRGLIDWQINKGLAFFDDDPALLRLAADYLEHPPVTAALGEVVYGVLGRTTRKPANRRYGPDGALIPWPRRRNEISGI